MSKLPHNARAETSSAKFGGSSRTLMTPAVVSRRRLPEAAGLADLPALNLALSNLFNGLREAAQCFHGEEPGGRQGIILAFNAVLLFLDEFEPTKGGTLLAPLSNLRSALEDLENNKVQTILRPRVRKGGALAGAARQALVGTVADTVRRLRAIGVNLPQAHRIVAAELAKLGVEPFCGSSPRSAARTVRDWCERTAADVGRRGPGAQLLDPVFTDRERQKLASMTPTDKRRYVMDCFAAYVRKMRLAESK